MGTLQSYVFMNLFRKKAKVRITQKNSDYTIHNRIITILSSISEI